MTEAATSKRPHARSLRWWLALPFAAAGGFALDIATPAVDWWPAAFVGAALIIAAVWQQPGRAGLLYGGVAGAAFWMPHIHWLTLYLGPIPWLALSTVMIAWFGLFGWLAATATRGIAQFTMPAPARVLAQSLVVAGLWVAREQVQSTWPYGGFAWGRIAITQADGPLLGLVSWLGFAGLSGLIVWACALAVAILARSDWTALRKGASVVLVGLSIAALSLVPTAALPQDGTLRIAAVQGNSKSAIFDDRENGDVIRDHIAVTRSLLDDLEANDKAVDLVVWPENSGEFQLPDQHYRALEVQRLAARAGAPIVIGSILQHAENTYTNSSVVFDEDGYTGQRYDKRRPVPFAEYMPNRAVFRAIVPELVDMVQLEYSFGQLPAVLPIDTAIGQVRAGIAICFDIAFDDHAVALMNGGVDSAGEPSDAQLILAQTNNADFGHTDQSAQQLQIAKLRAVETGRALINISTVGTSAIVLPDGSEADSLTPYTADSMVAEVPLVSGQTPALRFGAVIAGAWITLGLLGAIVGMVGLRGLRRDGRRSERSRGVSEGSVSAR